MNPLQGGGIALLPLAPGHIAHTQAHDASQTAPISQSPPPRAALSWGLPLSAWTHSSPHKHGVIPEPRLPLTWHRFREQRRDTVVLHGCISLHCDASGLRALLQRLALHNLQKVNKAQITILANVVVWLPFIHLVRWRTKSHNIAAVEQNEILCHLSTPRIYPCPQTVKNFTPFFQENLFARRKHCPKILIFCASS